MQDHVVLKQKNQFIVYDPALIEAPDSALFDPDAGSDASRTGSKMGGRNAVHFLRLSGCDYVLRHYWRGGLAARLSKQDYLWLGLERSRPFREWRVLDVLYRQGLPVPRPAAAHVVRHGPFYRGNLLTAYLPATRTLAEIAASEAVPADLWERAGSTIRRFHEAGAYHADLNANNILIDEQEAVFLIDWDRGRLRRREPNWQRANLERLARSLTKIARQTPGFHYQENDWQALIAGYERG